jgi:hypothetical protein
MRFAIRGLERDGDHGIIRLAVAEEGEEGIEPLEFNDSKPQLDLPLSELGIDASEGRTLLEVVDEYLDEDMDEWVIRFKLPRKR